MNLTPKSSAARHAEHIAALREKDAAELEDIKAALRESAEAICHRFLQSKPTRITGSEIRWHKKGSFCLFTAGPKKGRYYDHEVDKGGDMLDLIMRETNSDFRGALEWARSFLSLPSPDRLPPIPVTSVPAPAIRTDRQKQGHMYRIWKESIAIHGTVAQTYLEKTRRIPRPRGGWSWGVVRFHAKESALVVGATGLDGKLNAIQLIRLTAAGRKIPEPNIRGRPPVKQTIGSRPPGTAVRLPAAPGKGAFPILLAEGPETGLSAWIASGHPTEITLGGFSKVIPRPGRPMIICADDDAPDSPAARLRAKLIAAWTEEGHRVSLATPWPEPRGDKGDLNDVMQHSGPDAVALRIAAAAAALTPSRHV